MAVTLCTWENKEWEDDRIYPDFWNAPYKMESTQKAKTVSQPKYVLGIPESDSGGAHFVDVGKYSTKDVSQDDAVFMHYRGFSFWSSCATNLEMERMDSTFEKLAFYMRKDTTDPCDKSRWSHRKYTFHYHQT
eukprot:UN07424